MLEVLVFSFGLGALAGWLYGSGKRCPRKAHRICTKTSYLLTVSSSPRLSDPPVMIDTAEYSACVRYAYDQNSYYITLRCFGPQSLRGGAFHRAKIVCTFGEGLLLTRSMICVAMWSDEFLLSSLSHGSSNPVKCNSQSQPCRARRITRDLFIRFVTCLYYSCF